MAHKSIALFLCLCIASPVSTPAQEPITTAAAIGTIVAVGLKIVSMFTDASNAREQQSKLDTISRQLVEIKTQLNEMDNKLDNIMNALGQLGVKMDTMAETEQRKKVDARIVTIVTNFPDWARQTDLTDARVQFDDLENETNNLMTRSSFANYQSVALAMYMEESMIVLLKKPAEVRAAVFTHYENYFASATAVNFDSSIAYQLQAKQVQLDASTNTLNNPPFDYVCFTGAPHQKCCGDGVGCTYQQAQWTDGNVDTPFYVQGDAGDRKIGPGDNSRCKSHQNHFLSESLTYEMPASPPPPPQRPQKQACPADLEPLRVEHATLVTQRDVLAAALTNAKQYKTIAAGLKGTANAVAQTRTYGTIGNEGSKCSFAPHTAGTFDARDSRGISYEQSGSCGLQREYLLGVNRPILIKDFFEEAFAISLRVRRMAERADSKESGRPDC